MLFDAALVCSLNGIKRVYLGHEKSADFGNGATVLVDTRGPVEINHQYDKSRAFLTLAADYVRLYIQPHLAIESRLCKMWELHIAKVFCREPTLRPFHKLFLSCNEPLGEDTSVRRHPTSIVLPTPTPPSTSTSEIISPPPPTLMTPPPEMATGFPLCLACEGYHTPRHKPSYTHTPPPSQLTLSTRRIDTLC